MLDRSKPYNNLPLLPPEVDIESGAILRKPTLIEPYAGRGFTYLAKKEYSDAIADLDRVLQLDANFEFSHNAQININDVRLGLAEGYFVRQDLDLAQVKDLYHSILTNAFGQLNMGFRG